MNLTATQSDLGETQYSRVDNFEEIVLAILQPVFSILLWLLFDQLKGLSVPELLAYLIDL